MFRKTHPSWLFYSYIVGIFAGIIISSWLRFSFCTHWLWVVASLLLLVVTLLRPTRFFVLIAFVAGSMLGNYRTSFELAGQQAFQSITGQTVTIRATVIDDPDRDQGQATLHLAKLAVLVNTNPGAEPRKDSPEPETWMKLSGTIYAKLSTSVELKRSDRLILSGKVSNGFGTFVASLYRPSLLAVERDDPGDVLAELKDHFATNVQAYIPSPAANLGLGYLVGLKSALPEQLAETLQLVGMTHVVVASGAHLGILVGAARKLFSKISKFAGLLGALLLILFFAALVGFTPSMTRAALVSSLSLLVGYVGRKFTPCRLIILVATITLLINPTYFGNLGWQLSFASFFGLLVVGPRIQHILYGGKKPSWLPSMLLTSLSTSLVCAPILIYNFGSLSLLSFIANLFILPTLPYAMLLVFLAGAFSFCWPLAAQLLGQFAAFLLNLHILLVEFLSEKRMFILAFPAQQPYVFVLYFGLVILLIWPRIRQVVGFLAKKWKICYNERHENSIRS